MGVAMRVRNRTLTCSLSIQSSNSDAPRVADGSTVEEMKMPTPNTESLGAAKGKAAEMGQRVADTIDENRGAAASGLESAAGALREKADTLPGGEKVVNAAYATADAVGVAADYVRDNDLQAMVADVQKLVKNNPGVALLTAAALGFLIARTFSRD
jgi:ElaB/YqjD/DUF883 family membrane-anchored ribosome-binding protein